jgi:hypothetical protein
MRQLIVSGVTFITLAVFISCIKEKFDPNSLSKSYYDSITVATPVGYSQSPLIEYFQAQIDSGVLVQDADGMLRFRFQEGVITLNVSDIIQFPVFDSTYSIINDTGSPIDLNPIGTNISLTQTFFLDFGYSQGQNNEEIDSILLDNMNMDIIVAGVGVLNASMDANFPGILYNNLSYTKNYLVINSTNNYSDLLAYTVHLQNSSSKKNQLQVDFTINLGQTARIIAPGEIIANVDLRFSTLDFKALYGYIGQVNIAPTIVAPNTIDLSNNRIRGYFNFINGDFDVISRNSFGVPFVFKLDDFTYRTFYTPTSTMVFENSVVPSQNSNVPFPSLSQIGQTIEGSSPINTGPIQLAFQDYYSTVEGIISGRANPNGKQDYNFVLDNSQLEISTGYSVPFWGNTDNFHTTDTINFPINGFFSQTYNDITRLVFVLNFINALPMDAKTQIYFCDAGGARLDSMFQSPYTITGSSNADSEGKVGPVFNNTLKVEFLADRLPGIQQTAYLMVQSDIKTVNVQNPSPPAWKFFSDYYFYVHVGVAATVNQ